MADFQEMSLLSKKEKGVPKIIGPFEALDFSLLTGGKKVEPTLEERLEAALAIEREKLGEEGKKITALKSQLASQLVSVGELLDAVETERNQWWEKVQREMAEMVLLVAGKVVDVEIKTNPEIVMKAIQVLINEVGDSQKKTISISAEDMGLLDQYKPGFRADLEQKKSVNLIVAEGIGQGTLKLESPTHRVETSPMKKLNLLWSELAPGKNMPLASDVSTEAPIEEPKQEPTEIEKGPETPPGDKND